MNSSQAPSPNPPENRTDENSDKNSQRISKRAKKKLRLDEGSKQPGDRVDSQILAIVSSNNNDALVRTELIKLAAVSSRAVGACFVSRNEMNLWAPIEGVAQMGRLPDSNQFAEEHSEKCEQFALSNNVQIDTLECLDDLAAVFAPVRVRGQETQLMMLVCKSKGEAATAVPILQKVATGMQLWLRGSTAIDSDWQIQSLSSILELVSVIESQKTTEAASAETVNQLSNLLGCSSTALGLLKHHRMYLKAVSSVTKIDRGSETSRNWRQALVESVSRNEPGSTPIQLS